MALMVFQGQSDRLSFLLLQYENFFPSKYAHSHYSMKLTSLKQTITLPVRPESPGWFGEIEDLWIEISKSYNKKLKGYGGIGLVLQPFPRAFGKATDKRGGNAMGLSASDHDRFVLEIPGIYTSKADDETMQAWGKEFTDKLTARVKALTVRIVSSHLS
jgi:hypothetical protein